MISALRFFAIARLHTQHMLAAMGAVLASGVLILLIDPSRGADALAPLALLQMLAASSGFVVAARRGHLDLLLTAGPGRITVAVTHFAISILPGLLVWWTIGIVEMMLSRTWSPRAFASGSIVALGAVSTLAWALTVPLPRLSGGIAWLLGIAMWVVGWSDGLDVLKGVADGSTDGAARVVAATLCPFVLLGVRLSAAQALAATPVVALALLFAAAAVWWIVRVDVPLESAQ